MPAATTKNELITVTEKEYAKLQKLIDQVSEETALMSVDEATIKDTIGHRAHWITLFLGWYEDGQAGKQVHFPAKGYKWSDLKLYNAELRQQQRHLTWDEVKTLLIEKSSELHNWIKAHSDEELYGGPMKGANNNWTPGRWAEAAGPSHYRSAAKYIRQVLRTIATKS